MFGVPYNDKQDFDEIFRNEALKHCKAGHKVSCSEGVVMETVAHSLFLFNDRYLSRGSSYCPETLFFEFGPSEFKVDKSPKPQDSSMK